MNSFTGFAAALENWSKLPHRFIEALPSIETLGECKVILYVLRHTWGFQEYDDWEAKHITTDEFQHGRKRRDGTRIDNGIGMSAPSIYSGLEKAIAHGFIVKYVDNTDLGRVTHYYRLRMETDVDGVVYTAAPDSPGTSPWDSIDNATKQAVYNRFQGRCAYCEKKSRKWHYDHIVPLSRGGSHALDNLALACPQCNLSKNDRTPDEWGHPVIYYNGDVKVLYRGWESFFTGSCKETLPRSEKDTIDKNLWIETERAGLPAPAPAVQPVLVPDDPENTLAFTTPDDILLRTRLQDHARQNRRRAANKFANIEQQQRYRQALIIIREAGGPPEIVKAFDYAFSRDTVTRERVIDTLVRWAANLTRPASTSTPSGRARLMTHAEFADYARQQVPSV